ncbi:PLP-dependent cysteine synthase family protein [Halodesulfovibrio aestuarii]|uniref:cysteine synthase n=1 Tax=Halodesulfovibrio aestuarii TaxID=126333 RepID=A0A8G2F8T1_9BACT|nr:cysteine synthase family protein [Halodesulfovibrio aestuarii]SHJ56079.1 cysteine synthase A [Halodesulfovibrio aestuarii]
MKFNSVLDCVGSTPCLEVSLENGVVFAKAEFMNPGGSIKDRIVARIVRQAEESGRLYRGMKVAEATSGNTGISLAMAGAANGYDVTIFMPETASLERRNMLKLLGATVELTPAEDSVGGAVAALEQFKVAYPDVFVVNQFVNKENIAAHYYGTGTEIWDDLNGRIDCFVSGIGSGGTLMGVGSFLKEQASHVTVFAAEPKGASALLGHTEGHHCIEGIGDGFLPEIVDPNLVDGIFEISDADAIDQALRLAQTHGVPVGLSSGANLVAANRILAEHPDWNVVTILPDRAERYFSTPMFSRVA